VQLLYLILKKVLAHAWIEHDSDFH